MSSYAVAPLFLIRAAGVSFEHIAQLGTPRSAAAARLLIAAQRDLSAAKRTVEELLRHRGHGLSEETFRAWRKALRTSSVPALTEQAEPRFADYLIAATQCAAAAESLERVFAEEFQAARDALLNSAHAVLPAYLVFAGSGAQELLALLSHWSPGAAAPPRNAKAGDRERHIFLYLQRVGAKNDTFSAFGPSAWGKIAARAPGESHFQPRSTTFVSHAYFERWTGHAIAQAMNADPAIRPELAPRLHPNGALEGDRFIRRDNGEFFLLTAEERDLLSKCDGLTPAYALTDRLERLEQLATRGWLRWEVEVPALVPDPVGVMTEDIRRWRAGEVRARWLSKLEPFLQLPSALSAEHSPDRRAALLAQAHTRLGEIGHERRGSQRVLYSATNPIGEECSRRDALVISREMCDALAHEIAPWVDLWRDTYAFVASRVAAGLRGLLKGLPLENGAVPLPLFLRHCAEQKMSLQRHGIVALATIAFQEVKRAFVAQIGDRADQAELELTAEDCHVLRRQFEFPRFDEYTYPSADLQISAANAEAIDRGDYTWMVSELHPPVAMLHHCFYWNCPDPAALSAALASTTAGLPHFHFGFFAADFTSHTTVRMFDGLPEQTYFVADGRGDPHWPTIAPAEVEVFVDETSGDVGLRERGSGKFLGSFARAWLIPLGFHPFAFSRAPHLPRLRCGKTIVQRRSWTVTLEEMRAPTGTGVTTDLITATEELRAARDLPRYVYIRPTEQALRRSGGEGRDKDTKPVFIDLESYLSLEIFYRWLKKAGEVEVTEMLPDPDHLCWHEADGHRTFELRTLIVPRS